MPPSFAIMNRHIDAVRPPLFAGKVVLSTLLPGSSVIGSPAPSLKLVLDGEERYTVDGRTVAVRPGEFLYLDAGAECIATNRSTTLGLCLILPPKPAAEGEGASGHDPVLGRALVLSTGGSAMGRALLDYSVRIARNPADGNRLASEIIGRVQTSLTEPLVQSREAIERLKAAKPSTARELHRRLERARGFLHAHDDRSVALGELALVAGLSQFHLARYFKLAFGDAPIGYHRNLRLARAARLLTEGGQSIAQIAEATGYSDQVALSHAFRKHYGMPPHAWAMQRRAS